MQLSLPVILFQLREFDRELESFSGQLFEFSINFPPTYPYVEDSERGELYMQTRCPSWCDRVFFSSSARFLINNVSLISFPQMSLFRFIVFCFFFSFSNLFYLPTVRWWWQNSRVWSHWTEFLYGRSQGKLSTSSFTFNLKRLLELQRFNVKGMGSDVVLAHLG